MKNLNTYINESADFSSNDKRNFKTVANQISKIVSNLSTWIESNDENEDSDTAALAHQLNNLAAQLRGELSEKVVFNFNN